MKYCTRCKESFDVSEFTTKSGNITPLCRKCKAEIQIEWRNKNKEKVNKEKRDRYHNNIEHNRELQRKAGKRFRENNPEGNAAIKKRWKQKNKDKLIQYFKSYRARSPEKAKAGQAVRNAIHVGKMTRPNKCSRCEKECKPEGHHPDYSKPLEVIWLCKKCHTEEHKAYNG